jgi:hypothetical protein
MEPEAASGLDRNRPNRRWRWLFASLVISVPLLFGASNLALNSQWTRNRVASKIKSRTTLDASIGGINWSPWNGISIRDLQVEQPAPLKPLVSSPLIRISGIRLVPAWEALVEKRLEIRSLTLSAPEIVLPVELISHFAPPTPPSTSPTQPAVALNNPSPPPSADTLPSTPALPPPALADNAPPAEVAVPADRKTPETPTPAPSPGTPETPAAPKPTASAARLSTKPTVLVHLENASLSLVLASASTSVLEISGVNGSIPVEGSPKNSELRLESIRSVGSELARDLKLPIEWKSPFITMHPAEISVAGLKTLTGGQLAMTTGFPAAFECNATEQSIPPVNLPGDTIFRPEQVSSVLRFQGYLAAPSTWQADLVATALKPVIITTKSETRFDRAQAVTLLRSGTLSCVDARMTGDQLSFLGNATVLSNGKAAGVLRIVAPPQTSMAIIRKLFPAATAPPAFSSMSTPQRSALDIEVSGSLGDLDIRLGKNGPLVGRPTPPDSAKPQ